MHLTLLQCLFAAKGIEPVYVKMVARKAPIITGISLQEIEKLTTANATKLFNLP